MSKTVVEVVVLKLLNCFYYGSVLQVEPYMERQYIERQEGGPPAPPPHPGHRRSSWASTLLRFASSL